LYAEASSPAVPGDITKLESKSFPAVPYGRCLQFAYNMYGARMGSLKVYVINQRTGAKAKIFSKSGDQGNAWHRTSATVFSNDIYKVLFVLLAQTLNSLFKRSFKTLVFKANRSC